MIIGLLAGNTRLEAQYTYFPEKGTVTYEKKINLHAFSRKNSSPGGRGFSGDVFSSLPHFITSPYTLVFNRSVSLYSPGKAEDISFLDYAYINPAVALRNTVYAEPEKGSAVVRKEFMADEVLLKPDTLHKIRWKITPETRDILGYTCRRANALLMDSIYVVAFYTDEIPFRGGPECFSGLPGLILGVALPHHNITWFATEVKMDMAPAAQLVPPTGRKVRSRKELREYLKKNLALRNEALLREAVDLIML
ncbi:GLPGLI family protein [Pararcticibacter amylolyticus]|uniref:GLPGLI family protein n=1 Tax=Pararcticibacter amylolyticus TaxID=2173175 RepID=A0A2U2PDT2_9SPHI|nr:GLPGLI family protein [Pararcticibacter amylolyticus]PWG79565.1 GLPGLI family protein [Pararcticibacter amylolyticus]